MTIEQNWAKQVLEVISERVSQSFFGNRDQFLSQSLSVEMFLKLCILCLLILEGQFAGRSSNPMMFFHPQCLLRVEWPLFNAWPQEWNIQVLQRLSRTLQIQKQQDEWCLGAFTEQRDRKDRGWKSHSLLSRLWNCNTKTFEPMRQPWRNRWTLYSASWMSETGG